MGAHTTHGGPEVAALPAPLAAELERATPSSDPVVLEVGNHCPERAGAFEAAGWSYVSLEETASPAAVADPRHRLRGRLSEATFLPGDAFDAVLAVDAVERLHEPWNAAAQALRVLKPGGWVYVESALRPPELAGPDAPWSFGPAALRVLFAHLEERSCAVDGGDRVHYLGAKPARPRGGALREPGGCPACGAAALGPSEPGLDGASLVQCGVCAHAHVASDAPAESRPPQSQGRIDFYVQHVLRHLPAGSVLDLHPARGNDLLVAVGRHMPDARRLAVATGPAAAAAGDRIEIVETPAAAGQVDIAVGLLVLPFLAPADLAPYVRQVAEVARAFVFEVPMGEDAAARRVHLRDGHRQFFSSRSLRELFDGTGARVHGMVGFGPRRAPVLVAYRLPHAAVMSNGLVLDA